jgi:hypothetical protein
MAVYTDTYSPIIEYGCIAEEVELIDTTLCSYDRLGKLSGVRYPNMMTTAELQRRNKGSLMTYY